MKNIFNSKTDDFSQIRGYQYAVVVGILVAIITTLLLASFFPQYRVLRIIYSLLGILAGYKSAVNFFKLGISKPIPPGKKGVLERFGKIITDKSVQVPSGKPWLIPWIEDVYLVDVQKNRVDVKASGFSKDELKMTCCGSILYEVFDPHTYMDKIRDPKDLQLFMETSISGMLNDMMREYTAEVLIKGPGKTRASDIETKMKKVFMKMEPKNHPEIKEYGIRITGASSEGFDFSSETVRKAYEQKGIEEKEKQAQKTEMDHFVALAEDIVKASQGTMSFDDAFTEVLTNNGKSSRTRHEERKTFAVDSSIAELAKSIINKGRS
jgi:uncharacterized membrane protein